MFLMRPPQPPLLPAQLGARLAVLSPSTFGRHARQRAGRRDVRAVRSDRQGRPGRGHRRSRSTEQTQYPFDEQVTLNDRRVRRRWHFPLYLRVPGWCDAATLAINGEPLQIERKPGAYLVIERTWNDGDKVTLTLPMEVRVKRWEKNHNCVSVDRGPLTYSLKIGEKYVRHGGTDAVARLGDSSHDAVELRPGARRRQRRPLRSKWSSGRTRPPTCRSRTRACRSLCERRRNAFERIQHLRNGRGYLRWKGKSISCVFSR